MSDGLRDTLKQVSTLSSRSSASTSPLSLTATNDALPSVDLSTIQRTPRSRIGESDVAHDATGIIKLASNGSWTACAHLALELVGKATAKPHQILQYKLCHVLAAMRLADYSSALDYVNAIGKFDDRYNCYEHYQKIYPRLSGSMVPFSLRLAKAALPFLADKDTSLDQMFELIEWLINRHAEAVARDARATSPAAAAAAAAAALSEERRGSASSVGSSSGGDLDVSEIDEAARQAMDAGQPITESQTPPLRWLQRLRRSRLLCAALLNRDGKPGMAAAMLERELPPLGASVLDGDVFVYGTLVQLYVSLGDLEEAERTTHQIEKFANALPSSVLRRMQLHTCRGLIAVGHGKFADAVDCFHAAVQLDASNVAPANNRAVCMLYMCALPHAVLALEQNLSSGHLNQVVIGNLCTLYDLASDKSSDKKKQLLQLVSKYASDDFITPELAPKLSASGASSVSKPHSSGIGGSSGAGAGGGSGVNNDNNATTASSLGSAPAMAKRTNSITSPAAVTSKGSKKTGATTKL